MDGECEVLIPLNVVGDGNLWEHKFIQNISRFIPPSAEYPQEIKAVLANTFASYFGKYGANNNISQYNYMVDLCAKYGMDNETCMHCPMTYTETHQKCPITLCGFRYPVVATDGNTYEFQGLVDHFFSQPTFKSPLTREDMDATLMYNRSIMEIPTVKKMLNSPTRRIRHKRRFDVNKE